MTSAAPKDFNLAVAEFLRFLKRERVANQVEWIFPEDLQLAHGHWFVRDPLPRANLARARAAYHEGLERGLGMELSVICWIGDRACSYIYSPETERDAQSHLMSTT